MVGELNASHMGVAAGGRGGGGADGHRSAGSGCASTAPSTSSPAGCASARSSRSVPWPSRGRSRSATTCSRWTDVKIGAQHEPRRAARAHREPAHRVVASRRRRRARIAETLVVRPINQATEKNLLYREWVEMRIAPTSTKASGGRLGYVHMNDMSEAALRQLLHRPRRRQPRPRRRRHRRPQQQRRVRQRLRDRRPRAAQLPDDDAARPARRRRRAACSASARWSCRRSSSPTSTRSPTPRTSPKATARSSSGKVVGEPTAGWIIYTGSQTLVDGSTMRMPQTRITTLDGKTMELNPRPVDVPVTRPIGESLIGKDSQLDRAVKELLQQLSVGSR